MAPGAFPSPLWAEERGKRGIPEGGDSGGVGSAALHARGPLTRPLRGYPLPTRGRGLERTLPTRVL